MKRALISGITGQDGSYLSELLLSKGYEVHGLIRRSSSFNTGRIDHIFDKIHLHFADMTDPGSLYSVLLKTQPDEIYNLAAQSHVRVSFDQPAYTFESVAMGTIHLLDAVLRIGRPVKFYQASSSEMFGSSPPPQNEETPFKPRSPYAVAKVAAHHAVVNAREAHGLFACCGILFNHESERRGETFVTRKITRALGRIALGIQQSCSIGNLMARRDWGYAPDYVEAMWLMLQQPKPDDYVIATGETHTVGDMLLRACDEISPLVGIDGYRLSLRFTQNDPRLLRPTEVDYLCGDYSKASCYFGWEPTLGFDDMIGRMVAYDLKLAEQEAFACSTPT